MHKIKGESRQTSRKGGGLVIFMVGAKMAREARQHFFLLPFFSMLSFLFPKTNFPFMIISQYTETSSIYTFDLPFSLDTLVRLE